MAIFSIVVGVLILLPSIPIIRAVLNRVFAADGFRLIPLLLALLLIGLPIAALVFIIRGWRQYRRKAYRKATYASGVAIGLMIIEAMLLPLIGSIYIG